MISTEKMLDDFIEKAKLFNEELDANQKGYVQQIIETNNPNQYSTFPGFKILSVDEDNIFSTVRVFLRTKPFMKTRLNEKPRSANREDFLQISYKNGKGAIIVNTKMISRTALRKLIKLTEKA